MTNRTIRELLDEFDLLFRIEDDGSIHLKDYRTGKYAIYDWIVDSLYRISELNQLEKQEIEKVLKLNVTGAGEHYYLIEKQNEVIEVVNKLLEK